MRAKKCFREEAVDMIMVELPNGKIISVDAGENAVLSVITEPNAQLGILRLYLRRNAQKVASVL